MHTSLRGLDYSQSKLHYEFQKKKKKKKKKKISNKTNKNDNTLEKTKKEMQMQKQNWGEHRLKNQQHIRSSKLFNGRLVWHF